MSTMRNGAAGEKLIFESLHIRRNQSLILSHVNVGERSKIYFPNNRS